MSKPAVSNGQRGVGAGPRTELPQLPIAAVLPELVASLRRHPNLVVVAPPGAGKTTRVPQALYAAGIGGGGEILVLEPRRLATRLAASRVAAEMGESLGATVGYSIRFEERSSPATRIRYATEGVFARRIVSDPMLRGVSAVLLDEFHERHLANDLALAFLRRLQRRSRPDFHILAMSATLDPAPLAAFLGDCPILEAQGRLHPIEIKHLERTPERPLPELVGAAVSQFVRAGLDGDILVFLPGAAEIRRAADALRPLADSAGIRVLPLHGDLPVRQQAEAVEETDTRKVILSTNVAESSITVPGVSAVIDSGLARTAGHSPWSGLPHLTLNRISRASADQRAGRAGRTRPGRVLRLYTRADYEARPERDVPEVRRADLCEVVLTLHGAGIPDVRSFPWFEPPAVAAVQAAESLLTRLGALGPGGSLTRTGSRMAALPVHPRLGRIIVEGCRRGIADVAVLAAALLSEKDIRRDARGFRGARPRLVRMKSSSDVLELVDTYEWWIEGGRAGHADGSAEVDERAIESVSRTFRQIRRLLGHRRDSQAETGKVRAEELRVALLTGFPDRVAMRRRPAARELVLADGGSASLSDLSVVHDEMLMLAIDAEERRGPAASESGVIVRIASAIEAEWLVDLWPDQVLEERALHWNGEAGRVECRSRTLYGQLRLEETSRTAEPSAEASEMLAGAVLSRELRDFGDAASIAPLRARLALAAQHLPGARFEAPDEVWLRRAVLQVCSGRRSLAELSGAGICRALQESLTPQQRQLLERELPESLVLRQGRRVRVHYEIGRDPWVESRLQDFFGMHSLPTLCGGRIPLTAHLLAPSHRPVQVTQDLEGFWGRHYPAIRRELQRRYPKHAWPESPGRPTGSSNRPAVEKRRKK